MTAHRIAIGTIAYLTLVLTAVTGGGATTLAAEVRDDTGAPLRVVAPPLRLVSLAPGATEMLFAAGAGSQVVGTAEYSDEPPAARRVPRIGDARAVDLERIVALRPNVIVVWDRGNSPAQVARLDRLGIPIYRVRVESLAGVADSIARLGALAGTAPVADREAAALRTRLAAIAATYRGRAPLRVFLQVWNEPIYTIGAAHPAADALRYCGAAGLFGDLRAAAPQVTPEAVIGRNPDAIVTLASGGDGRSWLEAWRRFPSLQAVRSNALIVFDDRRLTRMGPGAVDAAEALCRALDAVRPRPGTPGTR